MKRLLPLLGVVLVTVLGPLSPAGAAVEKKAPRLLIVSLPAARATRT